MTQKPNPYLSLMTVLEKENPSSPTLPLTHCTKSEYFFDMLAERLVSHRECEIFGEKLIYLFYGRPSYKPYKEDKNTRLGAFRPISIIFYPNIDISIRRIYPFDTGGFSNGLYKDYIPTFAQLINYEIEPTMQNASRSVSYFFGSNINYYHGKISSSHKFEPTNLTISSLLGLFQSQGLSEVDDRRSAIEIQCSNPIELCKETVMAVCMPGDYCEDVELYKLITKDWAADIIEYDIYHDSPNHDMREVMVRVKIYLESKGLI